MAEIQPNGINPEAPAPVQPEAEKGKEIFNKEKAGLQAALLMDAKKDTSENTIKALTELKSKSDAPNLEQITKSSKIERDKYWKNKNANMSFDDKKSEWVKNADQLFTAFKSNSEQKALLDKIGYGQDKSAKDFYDEFFVTGKGNLGFFGKRIAESFSEEDLLKAQEKSLKIVDAQGNEKNISLLDALGNFYGQHSTEVARLVAEGMVNLKNNDKEFIREASKQIASLGDEDKKFLDVIKTMSGDWDTSENQRIEIERKKREEQRKREAEEAKKNTPEALSQEATRLYTRINDGSNQLLKEFLPILEPYKSKGENIGDEAYRKGARGVIDAFTKAVSMSNSPENEDNQLLNIISLFDTISLTDTSKFTEKEIEFFKNNLKTITDMLAKRDVILIDLNTPIEEVEKVGEKVEVETDEDGIGKKVVTRAGFMKGDKVFRKPIVAVGVKKKEGVKPVDGELQDITPENIARQEQAVKELREAISSGDHEFIKHFLPVLQGYEQKPTEVSDELYTLLTNHLLTSVVAAETSSSKGEKDQALKLINYLDMLSFEKKTNRKLTPQDISLIEKKEAEFIKLLADRGIRPIEVNIGDTYDADKMDFISQVQVDEDEDVNKITKVHFRSGFTLNDEVIRKPKVEYKIKKQNVDEPSVQVQADPRGAEEGAGVPADFPPAEGAQGADAGEKVQNDDMIGGDTSPAEHAESTQEEAEPGEAEKQAAGEEAGAVAKTDEQEPETQPTLADIDDQLVQAKFLADGRELTEDEKSRIKSGEKAKDVIKIDTTTPIQASDGNENK